MKTMKLLALKLRNFKGIRDFAIDAQGNHVKVFGDNATGKTTLFDAFTWLLFNKDSQNKADFQIKTLDKQGNPIHKLDHEVEASLLVDGKEITLRKVYKEKWTKTRGSATESFSGHTTDYFIDGVPSKKKEYDDMIASIVDEDIFQLLTNPSFFNEKVHWKDRRDILLEVAGDITDEDVIASRKDLAKLADVLNGKSIEDHKKIIAAKRKEINKQLEEIPTRIDEIHRNIPQVADDDTSIKLQIDKLSFQIEEKNEQINSIRSGSEVNALKVKISDIDLQIANIKNEHLQAEQQGLFKLQARLQTEKSNLQIFESEIQGLEQKKKMNTERISDLERQMSDLRLEYKQENDKEFDYESNCKCPTCEQDLPQDQVTEIATRFNVNKSKKLESINEKGKALKAQVVDFEGMNESWQNKIDKLSKEVDSKRKLVTRLESEISEAKSNVKPIEENAKYAKLVAEKTEITAQIEQMEQSIDESVLKVREEIESLKEQQGALQIEVRNIEQAEQSKKRIKELEAQEKLLAQEFEELEHQLYLTEEFTRTKVEMLEGKINSKFKFARFKLFENQINGGLTEVCETTYEGVPYSSGLNNAARINVGLDIINTLSEHYGVQAPIFVDNAESVTSLIDMDAQIISLVVSEKDKQLRVEVESGKESQVA